jgi:predicted permease
LLSVLLVAGIIAVSTAAGIAAEPRLPESGRPVAAVLARLLLWVLMPVLYFFVVARLKLTAGVGVGIVFGYVELAVVGVLAWLVSTRLLRLSRPATGAVVISVILANTGYLGLPLVTALMGTGQLPFGIAYDSAVSAPMFLIVAMAVGAALGTRGAGTPREQGRALLVNPPLWAVIAGLVVPDATAPDAALDVAHALVYALIPIGFFIVGLTLGAESEEGQLSFPPALSVPVVATLGLRLLVAPALMLLLAGLVHDVPDAYLLQAAMPCGANAVVIAHLYGLDLKIASSAVAWSTMLVLVAAVVVSPFVT